MYCRQTLLQPGLMTEFKWFYTVLLLAIWPSTFKGSSFFPRIFLHYAHMGCGICLFLSCWHFRLYGIDPWGLSLMLWSCQQIATVYWPLIRSFLMDTVFTLFSLCFHSVFTLFSLCFQLIYLGFPMTQVSTFIKL